jgi:hypothetical protein
MKAGVRVRRALLGVSIVVAGCSSSKRPAPAAHEPSASASKSSTATGAPDAVAPVTTAATQGPSGKPVKLLDRGRCGVWDDASIWCWEVHALCDPGAICVPDRLHLSASPDAARELLHSGDASCLVLTNGRTTFEADAAKQSTLCRSDVLGALSVEGYSESWGDACVVRTDGDLICWALNSDRRVWRPEDFTVKKSRRMLSDVAQVFGDAKRCGLRHDGGVHCWSIDDPAHRAPKPVRGLPPVVQMDVGQSHTCAVTKDGRVFCWGLNMQGQLGMGKLAEQGHDDPRAVLANPPERTTPQQVVGLPPASHVVVTQASSCALTRDASVFCWGADDAGQAQPGPYPRATLVSGLPRVIQIASDRGVCALTEQHDTYCWGKSAPLRKEARTPVRIDWSGMPPTR